MEKIGPRIPERRARAARIQADIRTEAAAFREAARQSDGKFGEQHRTAPGSDTASSAQMAPTDRSLPEWRRRTVTTNLAGVARGMQDIQDELNPKAYWDRLDDRTPIEYGQYFVLPHHGVVRLESRCSLTGPTKFGGAELGLKWSKAGSPGNWFTTPFMYELEWIRPYAAASQLGQGDIVQIGKNWTMLSAPPYVHNGSWIMPTPSGNVPYTGNPSLVPVAPPDAGPPKKTGLFARLFRRRRP